MLKVVRNSDVKVTCVCFIIHLIQSNLWKERNDVSYLLLV